jgi:2-polyprenyl-6-methoxyphenol hydroxylase-like FAD-dependent oxidoreductase
VDTEVLVVGAGPTGLTLAAGLLQRGVRVRVIDKTGGPGTWGKGSHSRAITLWPRALEAFQSLGVGTALYERGVKLAAANYYTDGRRVGRIRLRPLSHTRFPVPVTLPQSTTERVLRDAVGAAGGRIEFNRSLETLTHDDDGVLALLDNGEIVRAEWLVGCDGAHSKVRERSGVVFDGAMYPQTFLILDGEFDTEYAPDESYYLTGPAGVLVVVGLPGGLHRTFASIPPTATVDDVEAGMLRVLAQRSPLRIKLLRSAGSGTFRIHRRMVDQMRIGRVLLAGDAAHVHSPAGGLGLNIGAQDAVSLAWRLAGVLRGDLPRGELDAWEKERLFVARRVLADTDAQTRLWMARGLRGVARDLAIHAGLRTGLIERVLPRRLAQFDLAMPAGGTGAGRLRPGKRMPDVVLGDGRRLHDLLTDYLLVALGGPAPSTVDGAPLVVIDNQRQLQSLGASRGTVCLVRPDAVIAAVGRGHAGLVELRSRFNAVCQLSQPEDVLR